MDIREKITLSAVDIQNIMGCGKNSTYDLLNEAIYNKLFVVKKIGRKFYIPADPFWKWFYSDQQE